MSCRTGFWLMTTQIRNAYLALFVALALGVAPTGCLCQTLPPASVWAWYWVDGDCRGCEKLGLELLLDGKSVHCCTLKVRRMERTKALSSKHLARTFVFSFKGGHNFQDEYPTSPQDTIQCNIWQAGVESDVLILGVSFVGGHRILLNTLHFARPDRSSQMLLDRGLVIRTYPLPRSRPQSRP